MDDVTIDRTDEPSAASVERRGLMLRWGLPASVVAHLLVVTFLLITLPVPQNAAPEEPVVNVDIVDPPREQVTPEPEVEAEVTLEEPEQALPEEQATEEEQSAEEQQQPEPAEEEPPAVEEPEAEEPAVPEPETPETEEPQPEEPAVDEPQPEPEQAGEEQPQPEEPAAEEQAQEEPAPQPDSSAGEREGQSAIETLDPVFEFGEADSGPREQFDGNSAADGGLVEDVPAEVTSPFGELTADVPTPSARPEDGPRISVMPDADLPEAERLFSTEDTSSSSATRAMANIPRGDRGADLCATELREQLRNATPAYWPELLPAYRLGEGTVIDVRDGAFRAQGQWFDLAFRCEVDADVRRVVSFAFQVGEPIPRSQWQARGFPAF